MDERKRPPARRSVQTASGRISYTEQGTGPVALFVHGVLLERASVAPSTGRICPTSAAASLWTCLRMAIPKSRRIRTSL